MKWAALALAVFALGALLGAECARHGSGAEPERRLVVDTVVCRKVRAVDSLVIRYDTIECERKNQGDRRGQIAVVDSSRVEVPITQAHIVTPEAEAWVSGFRPKLDSLRVYQRHWQPVAPVQKLKRWHVGITAGAAFTPRGVEPCLCVGITYSFFSF